jgi:hypothetical protein
LELENGQALNEPTTYAVRVAIEQAVYDLIIEGQKRGLWRFKSSKPAIIEEKKDELVQPQTQQAPQRAPEPSPVPAVEPSTGNTDTKETEVKSKEKETISKPEPKAELKPVVVAKESNIELFDPRYLMQDSFVYKESNETSQRTWWLKKGTKLTILSPGPEGWHFVQDDEKRKGFVKTTVLSLHKP